MQFILKMAITLTVLHIYTKFKLHFQLQYCNITWINCN